MPKRNSGAERQSTVTIKPINASVPYLAHQSWINFAVAAVCLLEAKKNFSGAIDNTTENR